MRLAFLLAALTASPCLAESPLARETRVVISGDSLAVGAADKAAEGRLDCAASTTQHTVLRCKVPGSVVPFAGSLGRSVDAVTLNVHFQGQVLNMSVEFSAGSDVEAVLGQLKSAFGREPKIQYWADDSHLYASYIWVDDEAEVEVTKTVKGAAGDGKVRMYVSSLLGGLPLSPDDAPKKIAAPPSARAATRA
jgi:hypothetical protein